MDPGTRNRLFVLDRIAKRGVMPVHRHAAGLLERARGSSAHPAAGPTGTAATAIVSEQAHV